jgi:uncharacterized Tic20 family protein
MSFNAPPPPPEFQQSSNSDQTLSILAHVLGIFFWIIPSLVIMLTAGASSPSVRKQAVEALNFQITMTIAGIVSFLLLVVLVGLILLPIVAVLALVFPIIAAVQVSQGVDYRYPLSIRIVK